MNRFRLATSATLAGVLLAAGCASPCGCGGGVFQRMSMFRARRLCPCESCSSGCGGCGGGVPAMPASQVVGDGPILEPPGLPHAAAPPPAQIAPAPPTLGEPAAPPVGVPSGPPLGTPSGPAAVPAPDRFTPVPAPVTPAEPSSRKSSRSQR